MATGTDQATTRNEAFAPNGSTRPLYCRVIDGLGRAGPGEARQGLERELAAAGVTFGDDDDPYPVDPVPRLIESGEWSRLAAGLTQRHEAINAFLEDVYGPRRLIAEGVMPARVIEESWYYEPIAEMPSVEPSAAIAGPDLIRDPRGELLVLEDNLRSPSGFAYAIACREALGRTRLFPEVPPLDPARVYGQLAEVLRQADPEGRDQPSIAILSEGAGSKAWFEHRETGRRLGVPVLRSADLEVRGGRLFARRGDRPLEVHVLYNRSDSERLRHADGRLTSLGELLAEPLKLGNLGCVNSFGAGVADDKAVHCYLDELIGFYLDQPPLLRSVPGFDLGEPAQRDEALERLDELVIKPRWSFGGQGIVLGPEASAGELEEVRSRVAEAPERFVAQPTVAFSVHPTVEGERLEPRHVDLRAFLVSIGGRSRILPVALTRYAGESGEMVVNSTQGGGAKDTWILDPGESGAKGDP